MLSLTSTSLAVPDTALSDRRRVNRSKSATTSFRRSKMTRSPPSSKTPFSVKAMADEDSLDFGKMYSDVSSKIPPVLTAATIPVVCLSLLAKVITGHGLPGTVLGGIEGLSWLILPLGFGSLYPRLSSFMNEGSYDAGKLFEALITDATYEKYGADSRGKNATERVANISSKVDQNSPLAEQMADLRKREEELARESPEEKAAREKLRAELAASAIGMANAKSKSDEADADAKGRDALLDQPVTKTLKDNMTVDNYDVDVTEFDDKALGSTLNLSSTEVDKGAPKLNPGDKWKEQYRTEENEAGKSE